MIHKIQTSPTTTVNLEVKDIKTERCLEIKKSDTTIVFNHEQTKQLNAIIESIDPEKFVLKEYGSVKKWSDIFKIVVSEYRGIKSFQIRQRQVSPTYSGYGKLGITLPTYKLKELQMHMKIVMQEFVSIP